MTTYVCGNGKEFSTIEKALAYASEVHRETGIIIGIREDEMANIDLREKNVTIRLTEKDTIVKLYHTTGTITLTYVQFEELFRVAEHRKNDPDNTK